MLDMLALPNLNGAPAALLVNVPTFTSVILKNFLLIKEACLNASSSNLISSRIISSPIYAVVT